MKRGVYLFDMFSLQIFKIVAFLKRSQFFVDSIFRHFPIKYHLKEGDANVRCRDFAGLSGTVY